LAVPEHVHTVNTRVRENTMLRPVQISFVEIENDAAIPVDDIRRRWASVPVSFTWRTISTAN
jgi:hypothetical protein